MAADIQVVFNIQKFTCDMISDNLYFFVNCFYPNICKICYRKYANGFKLILTHVIMAAK